MQVVVTMRARGQALIETAFALPVFLLALFGVIWALKSGVLGERVELVARYGGMISAQADPYDAYSFYAAYRAAAGTPIAEPCSAPPPKLVQDASPIAAPARPTQPFWQPDGGASTSAVCGRTFSLASGLSGPKLLAHAQFTADAANDVPAFLESALGVRTSWHAGMNALQSPDMASLIGCYPELQSAFEASVAPPPPSDDAPAPAPLDLESSPLTIGGNCTADDREGFAR